MRIIVLFVVLCAAACNSSTEISADSQGIGKGAPNPWTKGAMVVAANPHAVAAAMEILQQGGHAVDAAIAAHTVLGLVEPQSSGIGGGGFMLVYDRASNNLSAYDGRETAPAGASEAMFIRDGKAMSFLNAWQSGVSVGVPGAVAMYRLAHEDHGRLAWPEVFQPAIRLATDGFKVSPRLANLVRGMARPTRLDDNPATAKYFYPDGKPLPAGHLLKNREYAETLRRIAGEGVQAFYSGDIAEQIVAAVQAEPNGGSLTVTDMENYRAIKHEAVCGGFRNLTICAPPPPSSGFVQIMIAGLYDYLTTEATSHSEKVRAFVDAQRLGYADRDHFVADPAYIDVPIDVLISPDYIGYRAKQRFAPDAEATPGDPASIDSAATAASLWGADTTVEIGGTTHLSIIDQYGNAVSLTASIEAVFGSSRWAGGFLLNNELTDFAKTPTADGRLVANAIAPGKRPRSSMSPTIIFDQDNNLLMVTGSPGGNSIIAYVAKSVLGVLDWNLSAQQAADYPNVVARGRSVRVEVADATGQQLASTLTALGYTVQKPKNETSGLHMIVVHPDGLEGGADKRREGTVGILQTN
ncbi:MAG: gamma-glutamyltransferase [Gammaproteobacteria bacterium]|jgi:gamma-glutamyltranspeptidase/glutathione hydrolase|nr:gamma-glutamyltransferase [Gammaproteobacteria bacterium]MDP7419776.1 gamma-glutamyltransferase [Gammaproteobacteria bacterium]MDP7659656.1 gamma-glutamyltransferase [Gammaproteobacteria bacterium]HJP38093.1 gamma-glutamyltransferase [Gammaproteobacteria bacterium]